MQEYTDVKARDLEEEIETLQAREDVYKNQK